MPAFSDPIGAPVGLGDGGMVDFGLCHTFLIRSANKNQIAANCKGCGARLAAGEGYETLVRSGVSSWTARRYLCRSCFRPVKAAAEKFPLFNPLPSWWTILDRDVPEVKDDQVKPMPQEEIERLIRQKEEK